MKYDKESIQRITVPTPYPVGDVHVYVLKGDTLSIVDAGINTDEAWEVFVGQLKQIGYTPNDIEQVILTHHHPDHAGFFPRLERIQSICGHEHLQPWVTRDQSFFDRYLNFFEGLYKELGVPAQYQTMTSTLKTTLYYMGRGELTSVLREGDRVPGHEDFIVLETPGHAQSHLSFYNEQNGRFFAGDLLLHHISSNPLLEPPMEGEDRPKPLLQYRSSLEKITQYDIQSVYPGHGPEFDLPNLLIQERLQKQEGRAESVYQLLQVKPLTAFEVCRKLFPDQYETQFGLTMSETVGQLDYLQSLGKIHTKTEDEVVIYFVS
ncbi:MBL fold metallo-hydrolase [Salirhabdus salicampi]|uniref:MBL fold metallo-hydrolase n=1 Tax=Salirhabdus salicampi TaxID=476102 RepID=UPI0020C5299B|nr:MBL fold metallo-hydrolase [Salirhabdus salicampi]